MHWFNPSSNRNKGNAKEVLLYYYKGAIELHQSDLRSIPYWSRKRCWNFWQLNSRASDQEGMTSTSSCLPHKSGSLIKMLMTFQWTYVVKGKQPGWTNTGRRMNGSHSSQVLSFYMLIIRDNKWLGSPWWKKKGNDLNAKKIFMGTMDSTGWFGMWDSTFKS